MVPVEISSPHSYSTSIRTILPQYTTRQTTDRAIVKGRLRYSIGGPKRWATLPELKETGGTDDDVDSVDERGAENSIGDINRLPLLVRSD